MRRLTQAYSKKYCEKNETQTLRSMILDINEYTLIFRHKQKLTRYSFISLH